MSNEQGGEKLDLEALNNEADMFALDDELEAKTFEKYFEINRKLLQLSREFKQNYKAIVKNEETYYDNLARIDKLKTERIKKRIDMKIEPSNEQVGLFMKSDLGKAVFYLSRELNKHSH